VLGAIVIDETHLSHAFKLLDQIRLRTSRQPGHRLRFNQMSAEHRVVAARCIGDCASLKVVAVVVNKGALRPDGLDERNRMHRYALGLLLERLSWHGTPDSRVDVNISHLRGMSTRAFTDYVYAKRRGASKIAWRNLERTVPTITNENGEPLLQLADIVASAVARSFKTPGIELPRELDALSARFWYGPAGDRLDAYGLKVLPGGAVARDRFPWLSDLQQRRGG
jgi:hypothetical protein